MHMAQFHDVTVVTRCNNRAPIEKALSMLPPGQRVPKFVYHDIGRFALFLKKTFGITQIYYILWQKSAHKVIADLHKRECYDLMHHLTFAAYRYIAAIWGHGVPCIWGPIGGMESIPVNLLPWTHPRTLLFEITRNLNNLLQSMPFHVLPQRAGMTSLVLVSTRETGDAFEKLGVKAQLMPTVGIDPEIINPRVLPPPRGPLRLLFVGNIIALKGVELAISALKESGTDARLAFIGDGKFLGTARRLVRSLGLESRVEFAGRMTREKTLQAYPNYDLFIFPSLHDSGGFAALEAMANGLPVICLDCGGLALSVHEGTGIKVPLGRRSEVVGGLAEAIRTYDRDRELISRHGNAARESMRKDYLWETKSKIMSELYENVVDEFSTGRVIYNKATVNEQGQTVWTRLRVERVIEEKPARGRISMVFSNRGILVTLIVLILAACIEFVTMGNLRNIAKSIAYDTMPGLSYGGEITSTLAQAHSKAGQMITAKTKTEEHEMYQEVMRLTHETDKYMQAYATCLYEAEDRMNFNNLLQKRNKYLQSRNQAFALLEQNKKEEALEFARHALRPAYFDTIKAGETLIKYNLEQGKVRGDKIIQMCYVTQILVALLAVALFIAGFSIGFFK